MTYHIPDIADMVQGKWVHQSGLAESYPVQHLLTDSRKIIYPETSLFIAIHGAQRDGHTYLKEVYDAGVRNFLVERNRDHSLPADVNVIVVEDTLTALQQLVTIHRKTLSFPVVGITGSNGKTMVKEWLYQLLRDDMHIIRSPKSFNSQIGVPLSVWQANEQHQLGLFEAGISQKNEMQKLESIIAPQIGIFTHLGNAHDEGFHSRREKLHEKLQLFRNSDLLIYPADENEVAEGVTLFLPRHPKLKTCSWSRSGKPADVLIETDRQLHSTILTIRRGAQMLSVHVPFTDDASINNACTCFAFLTAINRISTDVLKRFEELQPVNMRLQLKEGINQCVLINDSYSADLGALQIALDFQHQQSAGYNKTIILSDILQSGLKEEELYSQVARLLRQKGVERLFAIGTQLTKYRHLFGSHACFFPDTTAFISAFKSSDFNKDIILLKGARRFEFEKISALLEKKVHETVFEINLNALIHNLNVYRNKLNPDVKLMAMVKAFSYGAGSYEIAKVLEFHRVDYLTVAYADEGVALRREGIRLPIMVMNPEVSGFDAIQQFNLEPEMYAFGIFKQLIDACNGDELSVHLELDTGMKRLGFEEYQVDDLIALLKQNPHIRVRSVFTHLVASEEKKHDEFTREQVSKFRQMSQKICQAFDYPILRHCLNSGGIARFPDAQFDMVRLGIGLYGIDPAGRMQKELQPIGKLETVISQLRKVAAHETIGYNRKGTINKDSVIATAAIGYADGLNRRLGNGKGYMMVNGMRAPIVGNICMDMTMLDVTQIPCKEGDKATVFGEDPSLTDIAEKTGTIPYEVLTSVSQRVKRIYTFE